MNDQEHLSIVGWFFNWCRYDGVCCIDVVFSSGALFMDINYDPTFFEISRSNGHDVVLYDTHYKCINCQAREDFPWPMDFPCRNIFKKDIDMTSPVLDTTDIVKSD